MHDIWAAFTSFFSLSAHLLRGPKKTKTGWEIGPVVVVFFVFLCLVVSFPSAFQLRCMIPQFYSVEFSRRLGKKKNQTVDCLFYIRYAHLALSRKQSVIERSDADLSDFVAKRKVKNLSPKTVWCVIRHSSKHTLNGNTRLFIQDWIPKKKK